MNDRPTRALAWAVKTFTAEVALNPQERIMRFVEEAIELAHAMDLKSDIIAAILLRVYAKPKGEVAKEIGQTQMTLECLAEALGINAYYEADMELGRVQRIPIEHWLERHKAKSDIGIANPVKT